MRVLRLYEEWEKKGENFMSRGLASDILRIVSEQGQFGGHPEMPPKAVGRALGRIMSNNGLEDAETLEGIIEGYGSCEGLEITIKRKDPPIKDETNSEGAE